MYDYHRYTDVTQVTDLPVDTVIASVYKGNYGVSLATRGNDNRLELLYYYKNALIESTDAFAFFDERLSEHGLKIYLENALDEYFQRVAERTVDWSVITEDKYKKFISAANDNQDIPLNMTLVISEDGETSSIYSLKLRAHTLKGVRTLDACVYDCLRDSYEGICGFKASTFPEYSVFKEAIINTLNASEYVPYTAEAIKELDISSIFKTMKVRDIKEFDTTGIEGNVSFAGDSDRIVRALALRLDVLEPQYNDMYLTAAYDENSVLTLQLNINANGTVKSYDVPLKVNETNALKERLKDCIAERTNTMKMVINGKDFVKYDIDEITSNLFAAAEAQPDTKPETEARTVADNWTLASELKHKNEPDKTTKLMVSAAHRIVDGENKLFVIVDDELDSQTNVIEYNKQALKDFLAEQVDNSYLKWAKYGIAEEKPKAKKADVDDDRR